MEIRGMTPLLQVFDMPASLDFYCRVLGFEVVQTDANTIAPDHDWVWLRLGTIDLMLNAACEHGGRPVSPDEHRFAAHTDTTLFFGAPDVDGVYTHLRSRGIEVNRPVIAPYGMKQLFLRDPDGYSICFQWNASPDALTSE